MTREKEETYVTWRGFIWAMSIIIGSLFAAQVYIVKLHADTPYHSGVLEVAYQKSEGAKLEQRIINLEKKIENIEKNVIDQNKILLEILEEVKKR